MVYVWSELDHDAIFGGVESALGEKLSNILIRRNSYINRVYELEEEKSRRRFIVKFYRPGRWTKEMVREEHDFLFALRDKDVNVIPPMEIKGGTVFPQKRSTSLFSLRWEAGVSMSSTRMRGSPSAGRSPGCTLSGPHERDPRGSPGNHQ